MANAIDTVIDFVIGIMAEIAIEDYALPYGEEDND